MKLADLTDLFVLCAAPGAGDDLQALKRGINEAADLVLLNKAEEPLSVVARQALMDLRVGQSFRANPAQVLPVSAKLSTGISTAWTAIKQLQHKNQVFISVFAYNLNFLHFAD